jgi:hypothetical protein
MHNPAEVAVVLEQCQTPGQLLAVLQLNLFNLIYTHETTEIPEVIVRLETARYTVVVQVAVVQELLVNRLKDMLPAVKAVTE